MPRWPCSTGVHRSTITRAVGEIRPLLAARGFAVPGQPGLRLRTLADVFAYAAAQGVRLRIDGTEVQVRPPRAGRPGRRAFVSGKKKQNTIKATAVSDGRGRPLWLGAFRPGRTHDVTALRTDGIEDLLRRHPGVQAEADAGYQGLARDFPGQVSAPPKKPRNDAPPEETARWDRNATRSPPSGSASSTPSPNPSTGGPCSAGPDGLRPRRRAVITHQPARQARTTRPQSCTYSLEARWYPPHVSHFGVLRGGGSACGGDTGVVMGAGASIWRRVCIAAAAGSACFQ